MFEQIDANTAENTTWDVVIAGSSFSAMFFLRGLPAGRRVLLVEKGSVQDLEQLTQKGGAPLEDIAQQNTSGKDKEWTARTGFGGNSNCWWGQVPRFHPNDFELYERYGQGAPWPVRYDDLEPYYTEVEEVMEVAGGGSDHLLPRSKPFPYAAHTPSRSDIALFAARPDIWVSVPSARSNGGSRPICCANGFCSLCPIDAKFTILNGVDHFLTPQARLLPNSEVRALEMDAGRVVGVSVRGSDGRLRRIKSDVVALGANAIFNAAILMRSGIRNGSLGKYLHEQPSKYLEIDTDQPGYFGGTSITSHCYGFYDGDHRSHSAAVLIESYNAPTRIRPEVGKWTSRLRLKLIAEDLPQAENHVALDANEEPRIFWSGHSDYAYQGLARALTGIEDVLPFAVERVVRSYAPATEAHIQGTHRMGTDPNASVVDAGLKLHGHSNVLALGAGVFPTSSPANPTLTLSALALYAGRNL
ncbi:MAG: GMC family oxidoreductase [Pseudomonadota bacterium]